MRLAIHIALALVIGVFGYLSLFSIGAPFLLTSVGLLATLPWRRDRAVLLPVVIGPWVTAAAYVLLGPIGCTTEGATPVTGEAFAHTTCSNVLGLDYSGGANYRPPSELVMLAALAVGLVAAVALGVSMHRRSSKVSVST